MNFEDAEEAAIQNAERRTQRAAAAEEESRVSQRQSTVTRFASLFAFLNVRLPSNTNKYRVQSAEGLLLFIAFFPTSTTNCLHFRS